MENEKAIVVNNEEVRLGSLQVTSSHGVVERATAVATELAGIINDRKLFSSISGKKYVRVEGWSTLGAMLGVLPREVSVQEHENGDWEAVVELIRATDGAVIGRGSAIVSNDESTWKSRPRYAKRSMAITRATGKAYRLGFAWIMTLAGYEGTPAEEMMDVVEAEVKPVIEKPSQPMDLATAENIVGSDAKRYGDCPDDELRKKLIGIRKGMAKDDATSEQVEGYQFKLDAINTILGSRANGG